MPTAQPAHLVGDADTATGPFFFSCEHASNALGPWVAPPADAPLVADHWGWDPGAAAVCEGLAALTHSPAVLSGFSRLLADPNRPLDSDGLMVTACAGQPVQLNQRLTAAERQRRIDSLWQPYHDALGAALARRVARGPVVLVGIHSFTPVFADEARDMHVGVLCTDDGGRAARLAQALAMRGVPAVVNAPYSGHDGYMYAAHRHGAAAGVPALMIELRQDQIADAAGVDDMVAHLRATLPVILD